MMRVLNRFFGFVLFLLLAVMCVWVLRAYVHGRWEEALAYLNQVPPGVGACAAVGLLCLTALYLLSGVPRSKKTTLLSFDNEGGTVSISTAAICDYIVKLAPEFPSIVRLTPEVITVRKAIDVVVGLRIKAGPQIHEVCEMLQQRVRESMTNGLGISQIRRVEVSVIDIVSEHRPA